MSNSHTYEQISSFLRHVDGVLYWTEKVRFKNKRNKPAGCENSNGYLRVCHEGKEYLAHRVVWMLENKVWPSIIDHIDGNKKNNKPSNLRQCSYSENGRNKQSKKAFKGVTMHSCGKYQSQIKLNGRYFYLGLYKTEEEAGAVYDAAAKAHFGEFARLNSQNNLHTTEAA